MASPSLVANGSFARIAACLAHDLNNLLIVIQGCVELMELKMEQNDVMETVLPTMQAAIDSGTEISCRLIELCRLCLDGKLRHPERRIAVDLGEIVSRVADMVGGCDGNEVELSIDMDSARWRVHGNAVDLERLVLNLIKNAVEAAPPGGQVHVSVADVFKKDQPAPFWIRLSVRNNGVGIDPSETGRIFEPFYTKKRAGGHGMGLASVKEIVETHGGWIEVDSAPDRETEIKVYLPAQCKTAGYVERE